MDFQKINFTGRGIITIMIAILLLAYIMADFSCFLVDLILL